ncbi:hypothetical protein K502DRAFT_68543 [Neoconidiobolus thromboides FSU 785]|nr:hypothetical protein K502DRAFT_68543 [Neoconidiobolus thromboides FSU 785]
MVNNIFRWPILTRKEFNLSIQEFYNKSQTLGEDWEYIKDLTSKESDRKIDYLIKRNVIMETKESENEPWLRFDYHILYSTSYQVPIFYFKAYSQASQPLTLSELYLHLTPHDHLEKIKLASFQGGLSQQDHPILNIPYFYIHPCHTKDLLSILDEKKVTLTTYIASWLSLIAPPLGLTISSNYFN